mmetsp:Transcript_23966/g.36508  ORF Transcript_23966/g.36508 Transcript_23966/m.36508 type:complete len:238 (-) Transcript_23966:106-819(-)
MSSALRGGKGLFNPFNSTIGSSAPLTVTMKLPFPGFSLLTSTFAIEPTALTIFPARLRKAPQDLQCSIVTTFFSSFPADTSGSSSFSSALDVLTFFLAGSCFSSVFSTSSSFTPSFDSSLLATVDSSTLLSVFSSSSTFFSVVVVDFLTGSSLDFSFASSSLVTAAISEFLSALSPSSIFLAAAFLAAAAFFVSSFTLGFFFLTGSSTAFPEAANLADDLVALAMIDEKQSLVDMWK